MIRPEIRAVILDVGGVLVRTEDRMPRVRLEARLGMKPGDAEQLVFNSVQGIRAQTGELGADELWGWVQESLAFSAEELTRFRAEFFEGDQLDRELVAFIRALRPTYQTAIISNAMDDLLENVTERYPMADAFDLIVGSAYERVMKPDAKIFQRTLDQLGRVPQEAVLIDDFAHNIEGARAIGMHGIHFQPGIDLPQELACLGVKPVA